MGGIVAALLGKKYMDNNEFYYPNGQLKSPSKMLVEAAAAKGDVTPVGVRTQPTTLSCDYDDPADVDRRLRELAKEKGIK